MTQHKELIERLRKTAAKYDDQGALKAGSLAYESATAIEDLERENEALRLQLHEAAKNAFQAMPHDIPLRMKRKICVNAGWSGSAVSRAYTELRAVFTGEPYKANEDLEAAWSENAALRKDAERYRWLRHGDNDEKVLCNGPVAKDYWYLLRNEKLDAAIDAAKGAEDVKKS